MTIKIDSDRMLNLLGDNGEHWEQLCGRGGLSLLDAILRCCPQRADVFLVEQVAAWQGWGDYFRWGIHWNDLEDTDWEMVRALIVAGIEVTDAMLAETFGPQWEAIVALVRRAVVLTADDMLRMVAARDAADVATRDAARGAARGAAERAADVDAWFADPRFNREGSNRRAAQTAVEWAAQGDAQTAVLGAVRYAADVAARVSGAARDAALARALVEARDAARDAALAVAVRSLIGQYDFSQHDYDTLTRPWSTVIGLVHPSDGDAKGG